MIIKQCQSVSVIGAPNTVVTLYQIRILLKWVIQKNSHQLKMILLLNSCTRTLKYTLERKLKYIVCNLNIL